VYEKIKNVLFGLIIRSLYRVAKPRATSYKMKVLAAGWLDTNAQSSVPWGVGRGGGATASFLFCFGREVAVVRYTSPTYVCHSQFYSGNCLHISFTLEGSILHRPLYFQSDNFVGSVFSNVIAGQRITGHPVSS
jgi:hypothetical protein